MYKKVIHESQTNHIQEDCSTEGSDYWLLFVQLIKEPDNVHFSGEAATTTPAVARGRVTLSQPGVLGGYLLWNMWDAYITFLLDKL